jgi:hypothetical protein
MPAAKLRSVKIKRDLPRAPHSWDINQWEQRAPDVWPHTTKRARWIVRAYRTELMEQGAISRVGHVVVVLGVPYTRWLERRVSQISEYVPNNADMRIGGPGRPRKAHADSAAGA